MSRSKGTREPADACKSISIQAWPWSSHTVVVVAVHSRGPAGRSDSTIARWHLRLSRGDLAGHTTDDVLRVLIERVLLRLDAEPDPADFSAAVGPGAPLGATGGTVTPDPLPGL